MDQQRREPLPFRARRLEPVEEPEQGQGIWDKTDDSGTTHRDRDGPALRYIPTGVSRIHAAGGATRIDFRDHARSIPKQKQSRTL
jgi:hypothetical protein